MVLVDTLGLAQGHLMSQVSLHPLLATKACFVLNMKATVWLSSAPPHSSPSPYEVITIRVSISSARFSARKYRDYRILVRRQCG